MAMLIDNRPIYAISLSMHVYLSRSPARALQRTSRCHELRGMLSGADSAIYAWTKAYSYCLLPGNWNLLTTYRMS